MLVWFVYATKSQRATAQSHAANFSRDEVARLNRRCDIGLKVPRFLLQTRQRCIADTAPDTPCTMDSSSRRPGHDETNRPTTQQKR